MDSTEWGGSAASNLTAAMDDRSSVPQLLLEIMNVEHLWHCNEQESQQHRARSSQHNSCSSNNAAGAAAAAAAGAGDSDSVTSMCSIADHRLYKIVKWCKSLPLFKNIQVSIAS